MPSFVNISVYKFTPLDDLVALRERLLEICRSAQLRGTILLSPEGINAFAAGTRGNIDTLLDALRRIPGLADLTPKESLSAEQPFGRMLVKIKKEIIAFGVTGVDPARRPTRKISARTLKQWLDEGRPVTLLDTRNDYEVQKGTFHGALAPSLRRFRDFPVAIKNLPEELKDRPVVAFCTGGIRCEKAGPYLEMAGFKEVHQLDGGILKYFEECGSAHYDGECFVFDQREALDAALREVKRA